MKSDRQTYKTQYSPFGGLPLAPGDTESLFMLFHRSFAWSPPKDVVRFPLKKCGNDKKKELSFRDDFTRNLTKVKVGFPLKTCLPDASLWQVSWNDRKIVTDVGSVTPLRLCCDTSSEDYVGSRTTMSYELTMEEVLSRRKIPPDRDIGKYSQKAGNRYREARRSIESPPERDVSISWMMGQIQNTNTRVFGYRDMKQKIFNRLQLEFG